MLNPPKRDTREYLDTPGQNPDELWGLLEDIRRTNRRFGGRRLILHYLQQLVPLIPHQPVSLLDVATASADIPCAIAQWGREHHLTLQITALDINDEILTLAHRDVAAFPEITLVRANALKLPYPDQSFDLVICGLALHHFTFDQTVRVLQEIGRVSRSGFVVNDIVRSWGAYVGVWLDTRLLSRNRLARHDGPLSVLRSYTFAEFRDLVRAAGLQRVQIRKHPMFRVALVRWPEARQRERGNKGTREP